MSSIPTRPVSIASSEAATTSNQNASNSNKKQQNKPAASGGKAGSEASSMNEITENTTIQQNPNGPPRSFQPKPKLTTAERRAIQVISLTI